MQHTHTDAIYTKEWRRREGELWICRDTYHRYFVYLSFLRILITNTPFNKHLHIQQQLFDSHIQCRCLLLISQGKCTFGNHRFQRSAKYSVLFITKNNAIIDLVGLVTLEKTTKIVKSKKKLNETINAAKWKLDIRSNTFPVKVLLDTALKSYCLFPNKKKFDE